MLLHRVVRSFTFRIDIVQFFPLLHVLSFWSMSLRLPQCLYEHVNVFKRKIHRQFLFLCVGVCMAALAAYFPFIIFGVHTFCALMLFIYIIIYLCDGKTAYMLPLSLNPWRFVKCETVQIYLLEFSAFFSEFLSTCLEV